MYCHSAVGGSRPCVYSFLRVCWWRSTWVKERDPRRGASRRGLQKPVEPVWCVRWLSAVKRRPVERSENEFAEQQPGVGLEMDIHAAANGGGSQQQNNNNSNAKREGFIEVLVCCCVIVLLAVVSTMVDCQTVQFSQYQLCQFCQFMLISVNSVNSVNIFQFFQFCQYLSISSILSIISGHLGPPYATICPRESLLKPAPLACS